MIELYQPMTKATSEILGAIVMSTTLPELKKLNATVRDASFSSAARD